MKYNGRTCYVIKTSPIGPVLSICKAYKGNIMETFVMLSENNITSLSTLTMNSCVLDGRGGN